MERRPGVREVAFAAGVSRQTVSRVLNDDARVTPATRRRVTEAITDLGYVVNNGARSLRSRRTRTISIIVLPGARDFGATMLPHLEAAIRSVGSWALVRFLEEDGELEAVIRESTGSIADGAIVLDVRTPESGRAAPGDRVRDFVRMLTETSTEGAAPARTVLMLDVDDAGASEVSTPRR